MSDAAASPGWQGVWICRRRSGRATRESNRRGSGRRSGRARAAGRSVERRPRRRARRSQTSRGGFTASGPAVELSVDALEIAQELLPAGRVLRSVDAARAALLLELHQLAIE